MQIADYILEHILSDQWKPGDRIQSVREMAASVQVNPNTVVRSFGYLQNEGVIYYQRGIGYFVSEDAQKKARALKKETFVQDLLPLVFSHMRLLKLDCEDMKRLYDEKNNEHTL